MRTAITNGVHLKWACIHQRLRETFNWLCDCLGVSLCWLTIGGFGNRGQARTYGNYRSGFGLHLALPAFRRGLGFFRSPDIKIDESVATEGPELHIVDSDGKTTSGLRLFLVGVTNSGGKFVQRAKKCQAGVGIFTEQVEAYEVGGTHHLAWASEFSQNIRLNEKENLTSSRNVMEAILRDGDGKPKIDIHRDNGHPFLLAFSLESTGKTYLAALRHGKAEPIDLVELIDDPKRNDLRVILKILSTNMDGVVTREGSFVNYDWQKTKFSFSGKQVN